MIPQKTNLRKKKSLKVPKVLTNCLAGIEASKRGRRFEDSCFTGAHWRYTMDPFNLPEVHELWCSKTVRRKTLPKPCPSLAKRAPLSEYEVQGTGHEKIAECAKFGLILGEPHSFTGSLQIPKVLGPCITPFIEHEQGSFCRGNLPELQPSKGLHRLCRRDPFVSKGKSKKDIILAANKCQCCLPSRKLTYPILGKGKIIDSKMPNGMGIC